MKPLFANPHLTKSRIKGQLYNVGEYDNSNGVRLSLCSIYDSNEGILIRAGSSRKKNSIIRIIDMKSNSSLGKKRRWVWFLGIAELPDKSDIFSMKKIHNHLMVSSGSNNKLYFYNLTKISKKSKLSKNLHW